MSDWLHAFSVSGDGRCFCGSMKGGIIRIWDASDLSLITAIDTGFPEGFHRLAIDGGNHLLFTGGWGDGLACHDFRSGARLWHRSDLVGIQKVEHSLGFPSSIHVALEIPDTMQDDPGVPSGIAELDSRSGKTLWQTGEGSSAFLHPTEPLLVIEGVLKPESPLRRRSWFPRLFTLFSGSAMASNLVILDGSKSRRAELEMANFAILDVAFAADLMALAEGQKGVRIIRRGGSVLKHHASEGRESNFICAGFDHSSGNWVFLDDSEGAFVVMLDGKTGNLTGEYRREPGGGIHLIGDGSRYVDDQGQVCRTRDGTVLAKLEM